MSLDQNLFTLNIIPDASNPSLTDLIDPAGKPHYRKLRVGSPLYKMDLLDPLSGAVFASATAPDATSKTKIIELHNPSHVVELRSVGTISFKWVFRWEDHEFEWRREECFLLRKPDPAVLVAVTKEPPGRLRTAVVQILDYNLHRFEVADRKGLEIALLTALLTFRDFNDARSGTLPPPEYTPSPIVNESTGASAPAVPPKPPPPSGLDRIAEMQAARGEVNEVTVSDEGAVEDYGTYAAKLLEDDAMLFISIRSEAAVHVPKVLAVVEEAKRMRHKQGASDELHQYVVYDAKPPRRGRINLDDPSPPPLQYTPPDALTVHLSKIDMPELKPKATGTARRPPRVASPPSPPPIQPTTKSSLSARLLNLGARAPPAPPTPPAPSAPHAPSLPHAQHAPHAPYTPGVPPPRARHPSQPGPYSPTAYTAPPGPPPELKGKGKGKAKENSRAKEAEAKARARMESEARAKEGERRAKESRAKLKGKQPAPAPSPSQLGNPLMFVAEPPSLRGATRSFWGAPRKSGQGSDT